MQYWTTVELDRDISIMLGVDETHLLCARPFIKGEGAEIISQSWRSVFPHMTQVDHVDHPAIEALRAYRRGDWKPLSRVPLRTSETSSFFQSVASTLRTVPGARVVSYGTLARMSGYPGSGRAVGRAMSSNPFMLFVPCHRVIAAGLHWGGFSAGLKLKKELLRFEGLVSLNRTALWEGHHANP